MKEMHPSFPDWYRAASITPEGEILKKRWSAVDGFEPNQLRIIELVRAFFQAGKPGEKFLADFRGVFQKEDPAFPAKGNETEMAVLAGAELVDCWNSYPGAWSSYVSLAVVCACCRNLRQSLVPEIVELAVENLAAECARRFESRDDAKAGEFGKDAQQQLKTHCDAGTIQNLAEPLLSMMRELVRLQGAQVRLRIRLALQAEETDMMWWMQGEHSRDPEQPLSELAPLAAPLTVGKDLSDLVNQVPGPLAAAAFLERVLRLTKAKPGAKVKIKDAVEAIDRADRERWLAASRWDETLADLCPLSFALKLSLGSSQKHAWVPTFVENTRIAKEAALPARDLAYQMYLEGLLHRAWKEVGKGT